MEGVHCSQYAGFQQIVIILYLDNHVQGGGGNKIAHMTYIFAFKVR